MMADFAMVMAMVMAMVTTVVANKMRRH